ncbi:MAG: PilZ domain-containing protein [Nitrospirae bacterium]|nr:PilZ domain-containing protein [Nitrospirota bacterium]
MKRVQVAFVKELPSVAEAQNRRQNHRPPVEFGLMYSAQNRSGEVLMGDGMVTDLSPRGLGIRGNTPVRSGMELMIFLYLPDGQDPLFAMETRGAWTSGHRFGVEILKMNLREQNRLRYFLRSNLAYSDEIDLS